LAPIAALVAEGRLVPQPPDPAALRASLDAAVRDVQAAEATRTEYASWADAMLYEAGLRAARTIVLAAGYRVDAAKGAHAVTIDAADVLTQERKHTVFTRLQRMRRRRNEFMYETGPDPTEADLEQARVDVLVVLALARAALEAL
jgi:multidrug efflux pump subunit AcrA (membrane-fusion protein)